MINYIIQCNICLFVFYVMYFAVLRKETRFNSNRFYLLATLILSFIIPLLSGILLPASSSLTPIYQYTPKINFDVIPSVISENHTNSMSITWMNIVMYLYMAGILWGAIRFIFGLSQIFIINKSGRAIYLSGCKAIISNKISLPFSFLDTIYLSEYALKQESIKMIIEHEKAHIDQRHSYDVILVELVRILFWPNPIAHLYRIAIERTHEFIADDHVLQNNNRNIYGRILLSQVPHRMDMALTNQFFNSQIKHRIDMMYKNRNHRLSVLKYFLAIPLSVLLIIGCGKEMDKDNKQIKQYENESSIKDGIGQNNVSDPPQPPAPPSPPLETAPSTVKENHIYKAVDVMPMFPGCDNEVDIDSKDQCAKQKMLKYIYNNITYPEAAIKKGIEGMAVVSFIVETDGTLSNIEIVRNPGAGTGEAAKSVVESMNNLDEKWSPGVHDGDKVRVSYMLPVRFKMADK